MGADIYVRRPKKLDIQQLKDNCQNVPIDVDIKQSWIHFHYGYWGHSHAIHCEEFVADFVNKHKVFSGKWGY